MNEEERRSIAGDGIFAAVDQIRVLIELGYEGEEAEKLEASLKPLLALIQD